MAGPPAGAVVFWHVDDVAATLETLVSMGAKEHEALTHREAGFITASVVDPFGNILGIMYNPHYLETLGSTTGQRDPIAGTVAPLTAPRPDVSG